MEGATPIWAVGSPTVSVLITTYNAGGFLLRAVRSVLAQTQIPLEIVIVDDASSDDTLAIARAFATEDSRIRVLARPINGGPAAARNVGLSAARGDWIAILDADDAYMPARLGRAMSAVAERGIDIVLDNFLFFDASAGVATSAALPVSDAVEPVDIYRFLAHARPHRDQADWGLLKPIFRREFLVDHGLRYPEYCRHGEDFLMMFRALRAGARCILVREPGYLYSTRDSGMSRTIIDYESMITHISDLSQDPEVARDSRVARLLRQCIKDVKKLSVEFRVSQAKEKHDYLSVAVLAMTNVNVAIRATAFAWRQIKQALFGG